MKLQQGGSRGFTLIEILVVVLIIGIVAGIMTLSLGVVGDDRELDREADRLLAAGEFLQEQSTIQNREYGIRCFDGGYEFLVYTPREGRWQRYTGDALLATRKLPPGLKMALWVEGRRVILPEAEVETPEPQVLLYSSGEVSPFEIQLQRDGSAEMKRLRSNEALSALELDAPEAAT